MSFPQNPHLPPPPQEFLAPPSGLGPPPGLRALPVQYHQICPGLPRHVLLEHQQTMEKVANHQQHQQLLQQQLHRAHLELGAAHQRITKNDELTALLEIKLEDSEFKREEAKKKHDGEMDKMAVDLQEVESFRAQAATDVVDLQRWVQQQGQQLSQVTADLLNLRQQQPPPHHPSTPGSDSQARAGLEQELGAPGLLTATHKSTQTPGPLTTSASGQPFTNLSPSLDCLLPSPQQQCRCRSSVATHPAPARRKMPPPDSQDLSLGRANWWWVSLCWEASGSPQPSPRRW